ncbi:hypothetical protein PCE1_003635 [Barthelona sp. PCE]
MVPHGCTPRRKKGKRSESLIQTPVSQLTKSKEQINKLFFLQFICVRKNESIERGQFNKFYQEMVPIECRFAGSTLFKCMKKVLSNRRTFSPGRREYSGIAFKSGYDSPENIEQYRNELLPLIHECNVLGVFPTLEEEGTKETFSAKITDPDKPLQYCIVENSSSFRITTVIFTSYIDTLRINSDGVFLETMLDYGEKLRNENGLAQDNRLRMVSESNFVKLYIKFKEIPNFNMKNVNMEAAVAKFSYPVLVIDLPKIDN